MLPEISRKMGNYPTPLPRNKVRIVSLRKRQQNSDATEQPEAPQEDEGVEKTLAHVERNKGPPRKPPRRKLRVSSVKRSSVRPSTKLLTPIDEEMTPQKLSGGFCVLMRCYFLTDKKCSKLDYTVEIKLKLYYSDF